MIIRIINPLRGRPRARIRLRPTFGYVLFSHKKHFNWRRNTSCHLRLCLSLSLRLRPYACVCGVTRVQIRLGHAREDARVEPHPVHAAAADSPPHDERARRVRARRGPLRDR
jgi:hypothetical protein